MIVVDSSVWIANLQGRVTRAVKRLRLLDDVSDILVGDLILLEVLQGARDDRHAGQIETSLRRFEIRSMLNGSLAPEAAKLYRSLQTRGITVRKTIDVVIASFCISEGHSLLHEDRDFQPFVDHFGLHVVGHAPPA